MPKGEGLKMIKMTISNIKGGVAKTTTAATIAIRLQLLFLVEYQYSCKTARCLFARTYEAKRAFRGLPFGHPCPMRGGVTPTPTEDEMSLQPRQLSTLNFQLVNLFRFGFASSTSTAALFAVDGLVGAGLALFTETKKCLVLYCCPLTLKYTSNTYPQC